MDLGPSLISQETLKITMGTEYGQEVTVTAGAKMLRGRAFKSPHPGQYIGTTAGRLIISSTPRQGSPAIRIPELLGGFAALRRDRCARRSGRIQTDNDSPWQRAPLPCFHWQEPSHAC